MPQTLKLWRLEMRVLGGVLRALIGQIVPDRGKEIRAHRPGRGGRMASIGSRVSHVLPVRLSCTTARISSCLVAVLGILAANNGGTGRPAWAWGHTGHVEVSRLAVLHLPPELPAFVRSAAAARKIGEFGAEADVSKTTGVVTDVGPDGRITTTRTAHDAERDPGHYIDVDDAGYVLGGKVKLSELPATRQDYDTVQRQGSDPSGQTQYGGYLPYAIIDGFQQVREGFRPVVGALQVGYRTARTRNDRRWFRYQLEVREELTLRDIGYYSHFVADGSQPMHLSVHYNGWGDYPNPNGVQRQRPSMHRSRAPSFTISSTSGRLRPESRAIATATARSNGGCRNTSLGCWLSWCQSTKRRVLISTRIPVRRSWQWSPGSWRRVQPSCATRSSTPGGRATRSLSATRWYR